MQSLILPPTTATAGAKLAGEMAARRADAVESARAQYKQLLQSSETDSPDVAALEAAASTLGKTPADVAQDVAAIATAARLRQEIAQGQIPQAELQAEAAALEAHRAETKEIEQQRRLEWTRLVNEQTVRHGRITRGREAAAELERLIARHPDALE